MENRLLQYYSECLRYESFFEKKLTESEIRNGRLPNGLSLDPLPPVYTQHQGKVKDDQTFLIGYPVTHSKRVPLVIWEVESPTISLLPNSDVFFHKDLHEELISTGQRSYLADFQKRVKETPQKILDRSFFVEILQTMDLRESQVLWEPVLFLGEKTTTMNYNIVKEFESLHNETQGRSESTDTYLSVDVSATRSSDEYYHVVNSNHPQNVALANLSERITVLQGPPGTGKTQTILNLIATQVINGETVLVSSTNNAAVNNIIDKMSREQIDQDFPGYVRFGNREEIKKSVPRMLDLIESVTNEPVLDDEVKIRVDIERYKQTSLKQLLEIRQIEEADDEYHRVTAEEKELNVLARQLWLRIEKGSMTSLAKALEESRFVDQQVERQFAQWLLEPGLLDGNPRSILDKIRMWWRAWKFKSRLKRLFKVLKTSGVQFPAITKAMDLAEIHDVLRYVNTRDLLRTCQARIQKAEDKRKQTHKLAGLYDRKIETDRQLLREMWKLRRARMQRNGVQIQRINRCMSELSKDKPKIKDTSADFPALQELFPIFLTSNLSVRNTVPYPFQFDLVIVDEASQCSIPSLISLLQVAKRIVVIGDEKQLPHITSLGERLDDLLFEKLCGNSAESGQYQHTKNSAFDRALHVVRTDEKKKHLLNFHYRCAPSIIEFCNREFYFNRLRVMTQEPVGSLGSTRYINIPDARAEGLFNESEVQKVCQLVEELKNEGYHSIGVITPFRRQANALEARLAGKADVGTVHKFQGKENDVIIFSTVVAPGMEERNIRFVQKNRELINVAVSRAAKLLIVVGHEETLNRTKGYLTKLVQYIRTNAVPDKMQLVPYMVYGDERRKQLLTETQQGLLKTLEQTFASRSVVVYPKMAVKDTLMIRGVLPGLHEFYMVSHFDFVVYEKESLTPLAAIVQDQRESFDELCALVEFPCIHLQDQKDEEALSKLEDVVREWKL
ncbi:AAA family ATPase [Tumebacillus sp. ITR2]|uniref:AAA family ATPase n=1 Tax=Tumebacillus amylolyticus TaxID=2801339 RepID=A0ABS1J6I0_9BACL|nr:AAA domain-containing protein [Tumebacillus amylolyticus]MBL0385869.1 AAA family ATPase [Tumebacillus amylolyticus]